MGGGGDVFIVFSRVILLLPAPGKGAAGCDAGGNGESSG